MGCLLLIQYRQAIPLDATARTTASTQWSRIIMTSWKDLSLIRKEAQLKSVEASRGRLILEVTDLKAQLDAVQEWNRFYGAMLREEYPVAYNELQAALNGDGDG